MIIHTEFKQGDMEWLAARSGIPTASEMDALLTPKFKVKTGDGPKTYLIKKLAEYWQGGPLPSFQSFEMDQGVVLESEAIPWYSLEYNCEVKRVGFITTDDKFVGCSPDGLVGEELGLEIKAPQAENQTRYLLDGILPESYEVQVHTSLFVTGFPRWRFLSYRRGFSKFVLTVERDEVKQEAIREAVELFRQRFEDGKKRLIEINGGPPRHTLTPIRTCPAESLLNQMGDDARKPFKVDPMEIPT